MNKQRNILRECRVLALMSLSNIWQSKWSSASIVGCIILMVAVQATFLSMSEGFASSINSAGSEKIAIFIDRQSKSESSSQVSREQVELIKALPVLASRINPTLFSAEFRMSVSVLSKAELRKMNVPLRGLSLSGIQMRQGFNIEQGRLFRPGLYEIIIGKSLAERVKGIGLNQVINLGGHDWTVVGIFTLSNQVFETEFWADITMVQSGYKRENQFQSLRVAIDDFDVLDTLQAITEEDPRLDLDVKTEKQIYSEQIKDTTNVILYLGWPLAIILGIGALIGIVNIMLITLEARTQSIRIVKLLGFSPTAIFSSIIFETIFLSLLGALAGIGIIYLLFNGAAAWAVTGGIDTEMYNIHVGTSTFIQSMGFALFLGLIGGVFPALSSFKEGIK